MNILEKSHKINIAGNKEGIIITRIQAETLIISLLLKKRPKFIKIHDDLINTSFITSITENGNLDMISEMYGQNKIEPTEEQKRIHQRYLQLQNNNIKLIN